MYTLIMYNERYGGLHYINIHRPISIRMWTVDINLELISLHYQK